MKTAIKVGLDLGASRIKFSFTKGDKIFDGCFNNMIDKSSAASGIRVTIDGDTLTVGTVSGHSNSVVKKINYNNVQHLLFAVAYRIKEEFDLADEEILLEINTMLPPQEFKESREEYKALISSVDGKKATVNSKPLSIKLTNVRVGAECVVLPRACNLDKIAKDLTKVVIFDIGASTTDAAILIKDNGVWKVKDAHTVYIAGKQICHAIATDLNSNGSGLSYKGEDIESMQAYELDGVRHTLDNVCDGDSTNEVVSALISDVSNWLGNVRQYKTVLCGGGSRVLKFNNKFQEYTKFEVIEDSLLDYGNSRGALNS